MIPYSSEICLEMHASEIHAPYDRQHEVSPSPSPHLKYAILHTSLQN